MSSVDEEKAISGARRKMICLDESANSEKADIEMPAAHNKVKFSGEIVNFKFNLQNPEKKFHGDLTEDKQMLEKLESLESSCNNFKMMAEEYQQKVEELSAENEVCEFSTYPYRLSGRRLKILFFIG